MTTEEIEKAVSDYSKSLEPIAFKNLKGEEMPYLLRGAFKEGLEIANKHWQEKTRWIPVEERLPKRKSLGFSDLVLTKNKRGGIMLIRYDFVYNRFNRLRYREEVTHWKEIEL